MGNKITKLLVLMFWFIAAIFIVPVFLPLVATEDAMMTGILTMVILAFTIIFPIALILSKGDDD